MRPGPVDEHVEVVLLSVSEDGLEMSGQLLVLLSFCVQQECSLLFDSAK
jgi:hypothetical protein